MNDDCTLNRRSERLRTALKRKYMNDDCTLNRRSERLRTALKRKSNHQRQAMITTKRRIHLPTEIIEELFIRMPLKSITKFKCVCKEWNNFISGHRFRSLYQSQHRHTYRNSYFYYSNIPLSLSTSDKYMSSVARRAKLVNICNIGKEDLALCHDMQKLGYVVGSSNGLLLLSKNNTSYYVYDLLTEKAAKLPKPQAKYWYASTGLICKEGEQDCLTNVNNSSSYHYKIVRVGINYHFKETTTYELETYSSEIRIWQKSLMTATSKFCLDLCMPKVIGGVLHWKNRVGNIIAYNPEDPSGRAISIEVPNSNDSIRAKITGYGDGLVICFRNSSNDIDMWFLGRTYLDDHVVDRSRWTFFRKVCFAELGRSLGDSLPTGPIRRLFAIDFHPRDSNVIFLQMNNKFISYNLKEKRVCFTRSFGEGDRFFNPYSYFFFEWPLWPRL